MPTLYLLGTGAAVSDAHRTTTMLAVEADGSVVVVDCGGDVIQRLMAVGLDPKSIRALVITHEHPDHAGGFPLFMEKIWLAGRREPIPVFGIPQALRQARAIFEAFDTSNWTGMPPIEWNEVPLEEGAAVLEDETWRITATPGVHAVPTIGLRFEAGGAVLAYSCDTERSDAIARMALGADVLVHEATGEGHGHSSARGAAEVAREAGAGRLLLVHLPPAERLGERELAEARQTFARTELGEEGGRYDY